MDLQDASLNGWVAEQSKGEPAGYRAYTLFKFNDVHWRYVCCLFDRPCKVAVCPV